MKIAGVIAEYNPFHNGHAYHLERTREAGATHIVAVMSGSVVQRGDIAVLPPHLRAEAAVRGGADLVLELPPQYSLGAARDFCSAGVGILKRLGKVDMLSFGAETDDISALESALKKIEDGEPKIKAEMSRGATYPQAAARILGEGAAEILSPNNTLALEYLRALRGSKIAPFAVKRTLPHDSEEASGQFASASQIRKLLREGGGVSQYLPEPPESPAFIEKGENAVLWRLSAMSKEDFAQVPYCGELAGRLFDATRRADSLGEVYSAVKSRNVTHARVRRIVICAALGITAEDMFEPPFVRVLALNQRGAEILNACRKTAEIVWSGSLADLSRLSPEAKRQAELIELASRLLSLCGRPGVSEYKMSAKIIK